MKKFLFYLILIVIVLAIGLSLITKYTEWLDGILNPDNKIVIDIEDIPNGLGTQTNGELNPHDRTAMKQDNLRPAHDDVVRDFYLYETQSHVIVFRSVNESSTKTIYPNLSFLKTDSGLVWDGTWGINLLVPLNRFSGVHDLTNATVTYDVRLFDNVSISARSIFSMSNFTSKYAKSPDLFGSSSYNSYGWAWQFFNGHSEREDVRLFDWTREWIINNVVSKYFENMTDIVGVDNRSFNPEKTSYQLYDSLELKMEGNTTEERENITFSTLGSIATHLWEQTKDLPAPKAAIVDISNWFDLYIAANARANYPIGQTELALYNGELINYAMWNCGIFADVSYKLQNFNNFTVPDAKVDKYLDENLQKNDYTFEPLPEVVSALTIMCVKLTNPTNSDMSLFDITVKKVNVTVNDRQITFDDMPDLTAGKTVILTQNATYNYTISTTNGGLVFDAASGVFEIGSELSSELLLPYTYNHGYVHASMRLLPTGTIDLSNINFVTNPVTIVLISNDEQLTYTYVFNTMQKVVSEGEQLLVNSGIYTYSITASNELLFSAPTGTITIDEFNRAFNFTYSLQEVEGNVNFENLFDFTISGYPTSTNNLRSGTIYFNHGMNTGSNVDVEFGANYLVQFEIFDYTTNALLFSTSWKTRSYFDNYDYINLQYTVSALGKNGNFKARAAIKSADDSKMSYSPVIIFYHSASSIESCTKFLLIAK